MGKHLILLFLSFSGYRLQGTPVTLNTSATFHGTSTLHDFTGTGTARPARAEWRPMKNGGRLTAPKIVFEVEKLSTDHTKRDRKMMKMFDPDTHPQILGAIKDWKLGQQHPPTSHTLQVTINGKTMTVPVQKVSYRVKGREVLLKCTFSLSLKACGLKRPSVLGIIKVGDTVRVDVSARFSTNEGKAE